MLDEIWQPYLNLLHIMYPSILPYSGHNPKSLSFTELAYSLNLWKTLGGSGARWLGGSVAQERPLGTHAHANAHARVHANAHARVRLKIKKDRIVIK